MTLYTRTITLTAHFKLLLTVVMVTRPALAEDKSAVSPSHVKLPQGPGSLEGLGENVEPNLNMGLMTYGVPIAVPEGYTGLSPLLRIAYSSGSPSSIVGVGWSFGVPSIERMTSKGIPRYTADDLFAANGSDELVRVDDDANIYRARFEGGFVRYTWVDATGEGAGGYWIAEYPDGRIGYFGAFEDGTSVPEARLAGDSGVFRYHLVEMVDSLYHRIVYEYRTVDGAPLLQRIGYVWNGDEPRYAVVLEYENRSDIISDAKPGFETLITKRLRSVRVLARGEQLRRYALTYEEHAGLSRLARVSTYGMRDEDGPYPVEFSFGYTGGAGRSCSLGTCALPEVYRIEGSSGVDFQTGAADLVDLNGDGLPDIVDTSTERHAIYLNERTETTQELVPAGPSVGGGISLRAAPVQMLDLDGNRFADMVDTASRLALFNDGAGDWRQAVLLDTPSMPDLSKDADARPVDIDSDGCIDILHCDAETSWYWQNDCAGGFTAVEQGVEGVGAGFSDGLQLADMNGDGLQDLVLVATDLVAYWLSFGRGGWSERREMTEVPEGVALGYRLVDLSGDGLADLVRVAGDAVTFAINRNGRALSPLESIAGSPGLAVPEVVDGTSVRFADMNGSGSTDVVWIDTSGAVTYLELFPERPNLLASLTNGIGKETHIEYGATAEHMARDGGPAAWRHRLPHPMLTMDRIRTVDRLSGVAQERTFHYRHGYFDAEEKQFRGFAEVVVFTAGDETSEPRRDLHEFNVGFDDDGDPDPYYKGLLISQAVFSGDPERAIEGTHNTYAPCALAGVPTDTVPEVRTICQTDTTRVLQEGQSAGQWITIQESFETDGYGNRTLTAKHGVVSRGQAGCAPCEGDFQAPCGAQCLGDEAYEETVFVSPEHTGGRWILNKPARKRTYGVPGSDRYAEERYFYDGEPLVGLPFGELTEGLLSRTTARVDTGGHTVDIARTAYDDHGAPVRIVDGNGYARILEYDEDSLLVISETAALEDRDLRLEVGYHPVLDQVVWSSAWTLDEVDDESVTQYAYDGFGRIAAVARPGDSLDLPTEAYEYQLGAPVSAIVTRRRSTKAGVQDLESVQCFDGLGRTLQTRTLAAPGTYQVSGYAEYNAAGKESRAFYAHQGSGPSCAAAPPDPAEVPAVVTRFDGTGRPTSVVYPPADKESGATRSETHYLPLVTRGFDEEDTASESPHAGTPLVTEMDGLGRTVAHVRYLAPDNGVPLTLRYDELGNLRGYTDVFGNRKDQTYDLLGRVVAVDDPDTGRSTFEHDDVGNVVAETDARGVTVRRVFDAANRVLAEWEDGNREATEITYQYDARATCEQCTHAAGLPVSITYPVASESPPQGMDRFGYDARGQQTYFARSLGTREFEFQTIYDNAGRVQEKHYPADLALSFTYDGAGRLTAVPGAIDQVTYDARGLTESQALANGVLTTYHHDNRLRLARLDTVLPSGDALQDYTYRRDRVGNIIAISDGAAIEGEPSANAEYTYDAWYRLEGAHLDPGRAAEETLTYAYDEIDNIVSKTSNLGTDSREHVGTYTYGEGGAGPHAVTTAGPHLLEYGPAGNLVSDDADAYTWDFQGRMARTERGGETLAVLGYGPGMDRVKKTESGQTTYYLTPDFEIRDGIATLYVQLGNERVAKIENPTPAAIGLPDLAPAEALDNGTLQPDPDNRITAADAWMAQASATGTFSFTGSQTGEDVVALLAAAARRILTDIDDNAVKKTYFHNDHLGSLVAVTDANGNAVERRAQYPYGLDRTPNIPFEAEFLFTGKETDRSTGLVYFGARYYSAEIGRWVSADPLFLGSSQHFFQSPREGTNLYSYVTNSPLNANDPLGLEISNERLSNMRESFNSRNSLSYEQIDCSTLVAEVLDEAYTTNVFTTEKNRTAIWKSAGHTKGGGADNLYNYIRSGSSPLGSVETHSNVTLAKFELEPGDIVFWNYRSSNTNDKAMNHIGLMLSSTELANSRSNGPTLDNPSKSWVQHMKQKDVQVSVLRVTSSQGMNQAQSENNTLPGSDDIVEFASNFGSEWEGLQ